MKPAGSVLACLVLAASFATAGEVYGTITDGNKPVAPGTKVEIVAAGHTYAAVTDKFGSYRVVVREKGKCTLTIHANGQTASAELFSYDKSTRYDWILQTKEGTLSLRRK